MLDEEEISGCTLLMMRKKTAARRSVAPQQKPHCSALDRNSARTKDLFFHASSFHLAAKKLVGALEFGFSPYAEFDVSPVMFLYRHALELVLKAIVLGKGGNYLETTPDPISISKSHSVSWLSQFVCQIVTALDLKEQFKCEGVDSLADFKAMVEEVNSVDPGLYVYRLPVDPRSRLAVEEFAKRMDRLLELLELTADAIAAEWDRRSEVLAHGTGWDGGGFEPTIQ